MTTAACRGAPVSVAALMARALHRKGAGYYAGGGAPLGASGDFITAPDISQIFGELLGLWCVMGWRALGSPAAFAWAELGGGRGTLMADMLRATRGHTAFRKAARIHMVESHPALRLAQRRVVAHPYRCHRTVFSMLRGLNSQLPLIAVANEFFDCLPVRQFVRNGMGWRERLVRLNEGGALAFTLGEEEVQGEGFPSDAPYGAVFTRNVGGCRVMEALCGHLGACGGALLVMDYGHDGGYGDTLQSVRRHRPSPVLERPGLDDMSSHVDFAQLREVAAGCGCHVRGLVAQGEFLRCLGGEARVRALMARAATPAGAREVAYGWLRISGRRYMGEVFKAFAVASLRGTRAVETGEVLRTHGGSRGDESPLEKGTTRKGGVA